MAKPDRPSQGDPGKGGELVAVDRGGTLGPPDQWRAAYPSSSGDSEHVFVTDTGVP